MGTLPWPPVPQFPHLWKHHLAVFMFTNTVPGPHIWWHSGPLSSPAVPLLALGSTGRGEAHKSWCWCWLTLIDSVVRHTLAAIQVNADEIFGSFPPWGMTGLGGSTDRRGCTRSDQHSYRWKGEDTSAGQCCAGCLGEGKLVPFPAEPAC